MNRHLIPLQALLGSAAAAAGTTLSALLTVGSLTLLPATSAHAWWACPTATPELERRSNNTEVRCTSPAVTRAHDACPTATAMGAQVGTTIRRDYQQGNRDKCVGRVNGVDVVVVDPTCAAGGPGYQLVRHDGVDVCVKPGSEAAPTRNVP